MPRPPKPKKEPIINPLLSPAEVAELFGVGPKTVTRWAKQGRIPCVFTPGGHRRFRRDDVEPYINFEESEQ